MKETFNSQTGDVPVRKFEDCVCEYDFTVEEKSNNISGDKSLQAFLYDWLKQNCKNKEVGSATVYYYKDKIIGNEIGNVLNLYIKPIGSCGIRNNNGYVFLSLIKDYKVIVNSEVKYITDVLVLEGSSGARVEGFEFKDNLIIECIDWRLNNLIVHGYEGNRELHSVILRYDRTNSVETMGTCLKEGEYWFIRFENSTATLKLNCNEYDIPNNIFVHIPENDTELVGVKGNVNEFIESIRNKFYSYLSEDDSYADYIRCSIKKLEQSKSNVRGYSRYEFKN